MFTLPKKITATWLKKLGACEDGVREFTDRFPVGVVPSAAALKQMSISNVSWLADVLSEEIDLHEFYNKKTAALTLRNKHKDEVYRLHDSLYKLLNHELLNKHVSVDVSILIRRAVDASIVEIERIYKNTMCEALMDTVLKQVS